MEISNEIQKGGPQYDWPSEVSRDDVTIVIPALNETQAVKLVIEETRRAGFRNILVLDGGSTDSTVDAARELSIPVILQHGKGKADALDTAISIVKTDFMGIIDADRTYDPLDFNKMLLHAKKADMVIGSRILGSSKKKPFVAGHGIANRIFNKLFNWIYGADLTDILSGIRLINMKMFRNFHFRSNGFAVESEMASQVFSEGGKIVEVPISFRDRIGDAKLRYRDGYHILSTITRMAYEFNPLLFFFPIGLLLLIPGSLVIGYVLIEASLAGIFHYSLALLGFGLALSGIQIMGFSVLSFLMKRIELRQLRAIHRIKASELA